ncbi:DUF4157 domain-containing protein [Nostoc sp. NMS4]|uniref:eCIS core domain-containing protein n=1 Tax=Nostoc sp. NMS4 TaxID=2815390 RepID=UPI0025EE8AC1|nr:DUF4157 domain-containing protein [Nostoc sp. NMS4]MBN3923788.1 DUF4157 domain-containing protein [Nostoc sp. NMS4]
MTFQKIQKTAFTKTEIPTTSQFTLRPFAAIIQPPILTPLQQSEQTKGLVQRKTNLLPIPLMRLPKKVIQAKLTIGETGDEYEQEAETVARQVVQRLHTPMPKQTLSMIQSMKGNTLLQRCLQQASLRDATRTPTHGHQSEILTNKTNLLKRPAVGTKGQSQMMSQVQPILQRREHSGNGMTDAPDLEASIQQVRGRGQPLEKKTQKQMRQAFGADFSKVKVHTDGQSDQLNRSIQAKAFTTQQDVFSRQGEYNPASRGGQELLAHQLTPVVQQNGSAVQAKSDIVQRAPDTVPVEDQRVTDDPSIMDKHKKNEGGRFEKINQPLFKIDKKTGKPRKPSIDDVIQGNVGDCYLLAAIAAIVETNPEYIFGMLTDLGDKVSVRLYDEDRSDPEKRKFPVRYITVWKSVAINDKGDWLYAQNSLWVNILEKAYAAAGFGGFYKTTADKKIPPSYDKIDRGDARFALQVLLGETISNNDIHSGKAQKNTNLQGLPWSKEECESYNIAKSTNNNYETLVSYEIFEKDVNKIHKWMDWLITRNGGKAIEKLYFEKKEGTYEEEIRLEDFLTKFAEEKLDQTLINDLEYYLQDFFPGKKGTALYTKYQFDWYKDIKKKIKNKQPVVVGSKEKVGRGNLEELDSSKGLVPSHAYTVTDYYRDKKSGLLYLILFEPQRSFAREYNMDASKGNKAKGKIAPGEVTEFLVELSDFTKRYNLISYPKDEKKR